MGRPKPPTVSIEYDMSMKRYEVGVTRDDKQTDVAQVLMYDDGHVEAKVWTLEEFGRTLTEAIIEAVKEVYDRGVFSRGSD